MTGSSTFGVIGIIGGTGAQGRGLAFRLASAGHEVVIGSRTFERALDAANGLNALLPQGRPRIGAASNADAAIAASLAIIAVPYDPQAEALSELAGLLDGKIAVSCLNPLGFDAKGPYGLDVPQGSAAEHIAALLPETAVAAAFHHVSARNLLDDSPPDEDILVCGDDPGVRSVVMELARDVGGRPGIDAGPLRMSRYLEPMTAVLISINKNYRAHAGISITGLPEQDHAGEPELRRPA
jgi:NADPH-dependent F420 reductase